MDDRKMAKIGLKYFLPNMTTVVPPHPLIHYPYFQLSAARKNGKLKKQTVHKFPNAHQAIKGRNMMKSSSPNAPST
jgi:hypothetical protein